jgi:hypothetical protein
MPAKNYGLVSTGLFARRRRLILQMYAGAARTGSNPLSKNEARVMLSEEIENALQAAGVRLKAKTRMHQDNGFRLRFAGGEIVLVLDNGTVCVQGQRRRQVKSLLRALLNITPS